MTTRSLRALIEGLSTKYSTTLVISSLTRPDRGFGLRFADLSEKHTFQLNIQRHWKSTEIVFKADAFASKTIGYLAEQVFEKKVEIENILVANRLKFSTCEISLNGKSYLDQQISAPFSTFEFSASILTDESSIDNGLVTDEEASFISVCLELFALLLPLTLARYTNPDEVAGFPEGAVTHVVVNKYERDPRNRKIAIDLHGTKCLACGFDFEAIYGPLGREYIVIHHTTPVSSMGADYLVNPASDLVPICANCHAMVHRRNPPISIAELRGILNKGERK